jgi:histidyl-tRNA synthetase
VCAGGRYDGLVAALGGPSTPGVGFALGIERFLMILAKRETGAVPVRAGLAVVTLGDAARGYAIGLLAALRRTSAELPVTIDYGEAKIAAQFKKADRAGARAAVIVGDDELVSSSVKVRDLVTRVQDTLGPHTGASEAAEAVLRWYRALPAQSDAAA